MSLSEGSWKSFCADVKMWQKLQRNKRNELIMKYMMPEAPSIKETKYQIRCGAMTVLPLSSDSNVKRMFLESIFLKLVLILLMSLCCTLFITKALMSPNCLSVLIEMFCLSLIWSKFDVYLIKRLLTH